MTSRAPSRLRLTVLLAGCLLLLGFWGHAATASGHAGRTRPWTVRLPGTLYIVQDLGFTISGPADGRILTYRASKLHTFLHRLILTAPAMAPDHTTLALGETSLASSENSLDTIRRDGTHHRLIARPPRSPCANYDLAMYDAGWSPNGHMLAYEVGLFTDVIHGCPPGVRDVTGLWVTSVQHPAPHQVSSGRFVGWGPDSHTILFVDAIGGRGGIYRRDVRTGATHLIRAGSPTAVVVAPRSHRLAYALQSGMNRSDLWVAGPQGQQAHIVDHVQGNVSFLQWSPDEHALISPVSRAAQTADGNTSWLRVTQLGRGHSATTLATPGTLLEPVWSPDSRSVAYIWQHGTRDRQSSVWVIGARGGTPHLVFQIRSRDFPPVASSLEHLAWF